jgi:hypothetical protein
MEISRILNFWILPVTCTSSMSVSCVFHPVYQNVALFIPEFLHGFVVHRGTPAQEHGTEQQQPKPTGNGRR